MNTTKHTEVLQYTHNLVLLYVEDDESISSRLVKVFEKFFKKVILGFDGQDGLTKFNENHIDLVISDINMPNLNGFEMLKQIKQLAPDTPSILTTAHQDKEHYKDALELNIKIYIPKPIDLSQLIDAIHKISKEINNEKVKFDKYNELLNANKKILHLGYEISQQKDINKLLEEILIGAKELSFADGGTVYTLNEKTKTLDFKIVINDTLDIHNGGTDTKELWKPLELYNEDGSLNDKNVAVVCSTKDKLININNIYQSTNYNFEGAKLFDESLSYKTTSMLVIPMKNREDKVIGVIQLVNKLDKNKEVTSFIACDEALIKAMAAIGAMVIENNTLINDLENLLYSLIKSIDSAINAKSKYTSDHIDKVAIISELIANGVNKNQTIYKDFEFNENELEEIRLSALLHDIGKISTPSYIMDKATKLEKIVDRIENIKIKVELEKKDIEILFLKGEISQEKKEEKQLLLDSYYEFLKTINYGNSNMDDKNVEKLNQIFKTTNILTEDEYKNLSIKFGTLNEDDRKVINEHVILTYDIIKEINFPDKFSNVVKIASSHHKTLDKKGYGPKELMDKEMTIADKILAVADVFEALSTKDRPYKKPFTLNKIANIFAQKIKNKELDKDIIKMFFEDELYLEYANKHLLKEQLDTITVNFENI